MGAVAVLGGRGRGVIGLRGPGRQLGAGPEAARGEWMAERKSARSRQEHSGTLPQVRSTRPLPPGLLTESLEATS